MKWFLAGDYNIDLLKSSVNSHTNDFLNHILSYNLFPAIAKPTRITTDTATLIDNIFMNTFDEIERIHTGILYTDVSDHLPVFILY